MKKSAFFSTPKVHETDIELEGEKVLIKKLSQSDVEAMRREYSDPDKQLAGYRFVVLKTVVDSDGTRLFDDKAMTELCDVDYEVIEQIAIASLTHSGLIKKAESKKV